MTTRKINLSMAIIPFLVLAMALIVYVVVSGRNFDIRKRASTPTGTSELIVQPTTNSYYVGDIFTLDVMLNTAGRAISSAGFRLFYPFTTDTPEIEVRDQGDPAGVQIRSFSTQLDQNFTTNINQVIKEPATNGNVYIDFSALIQTAAGYSNSSGQRFASISFKAHRAGTFTIQHDPVKSQITDKETGLDVLKTISAVGVTIGTETQKPEITFQGGPAEGAVSTSSAVQFSFSATDKPVRPANVIVPLVYNYKYDAETATAYQPLSGNVTVLPVKVLGHGQHTLTINVKDPENNVGTITRTFTVNATPHIDSIVPEEGTAGVQVTLTGYNFAGQTKVKFGNVFVADADYVSRSATQLVVKVPANAGNAVRVVNTQYNLTSNAVTFTPRTRLTLFIPLQGITQDRGAKTATVVVKCGTFTETFANKTLTWADASGNRPASYRFTELFPAATVVPTATNCTVSIKETSRLRKRFGNVSIAPTLNNVVNRADAANRLLVADFDNNNALELQDFGLLMANFTATTGLSVPVTDANRKFDLNGDNSLTIDDIALLLTNLTSLQKVGDPE